MEKKEKDIDVSINHASKNEFPSERFQGRLYGFSWVLLETRDPNYNPVLKEDNVTRIEYGYLRFSFRKEMDGEYYTYFSWEDETTLGVIGIAEVNNQFISIGMPKKDDDESE